MVIGYWLLVIGERLRRFLRHVGRYLLTFSLFLHVVYAQSLQSVIDAAPAGARVDLPSGVFRGAIVIDKPLMLVGSKKGESVIDGGGGGSVVTVRASHVTLKNLTIVGSGRRRDVLDAAVKMAGVADVTVLDCRMKKDLFGVVVETSRDVKILDNTIRSYRDKVVDNRGDGVRIWGSHDVKVEGNRFMQTRDIAVTRSYDVKILKNRIRNARYGVLLDMSRQVEVKGNDITDIYAGVRTKGGMGLNIEGNTIFDTRLETGVGILLAHGKAVRVRRNRISGCAQAIYIDSSPAEEGMRRYIERNAIVNNNEAFHFHAAIQNNTIRHNDVVGNLDDVVLDIPRAKRCNNDIGYNYWDRYQGFDRNHDGIGDTPYVVLIFADKLWQYNHHAKFFYGSPVLSMLDFIERIAPLTQPDELLRDPKPRMKRNF
ncbi:nitrous oxide reductase family maturation protein NosD [Hydrogenimonas urashimensis]|uniref:nitrous oxide reductase family maturation protein NosD n=1 Tax=Hydrogenimonas urashimensis TaxID=2740515 RepID=UPI0019162E7B|nr:nitrous oxide reductase family maturation protein NosD [Hydrogenimonas urashimensis]